jgi:hypothetical protein
LMLLPVQVVTPFVQRCVWAKGGAAELVSAGLEPNNGGINT